MRVAKYIAVVVLVVALAGVAYVRALYSRQKQTGSEARMVPVTEVNRLADSLRRYYIDSVGSASAAVPIPPVSKEGDSLRAEIVRLQADLTAANGRIKELDSSATRKIERAIRAYYNEEVAALPADLSSYERTVSIKEIKARASKCFGVSAEALGRILARKK
jgi:hypothetical protein